MATTKAHNPIFARAQTWKQRLGLGVAAWVVLGVVTAFLAPRGSGLISLMGGAAWFGTGAGLAATYTIAHAVYQHKGQIAGLVAGGLGVAVVCVLFVVVDWNAVASAVGMVVGGIIVVALFLRDPQRFLSVDKDDEEESLVNNDEVDGWRDGIDGYGHYMGGLRVDEDA